MSAVVTRPLAPVPRRTHLPARRRSAAALIPLALFATACGGVGQDWANQAKRAADSPVGNTGEPNVGITAEELMKRVAEADRSARSVGTEFSGQLYGVPVHGDTSVTRTGDIESHLTLKDREIHVLVIGKTEYSKLEQGTYAVLFGIIAKAPGYDADLEEPGDGFREFGKLLEGKYLKDEAATRGTGFQSFDSVLGGGPFTNGDDSEDGDEETDDYDDDYERDDEVGYQLGDTQRIGGIEVIPLIVTTETRQGDKSVQTLYVPTHGTPLPVRMTSDDDNDGKVDASIDTRYSKLDPDRKVTAPDKDQTVDLDTVMEDFFGDLDDLGDSDDPDSPYGGGDEDDEDDSLAPA